MRLGIIGMLPEDFRTFTADELRSIRELGFTGFGTHLGGDGLFEVTTEDCEKCKKLLTREELDFVQFSITYNECLFHPDTTVRESGIVKINRGTEIASQVGAHVYLIRPGSLNPAGHWTPHPDNFRPECMDRLIETLRPIAQKAEAEGVTIVMETHAISIMDSPETCKRVVEKVGSDNLKIVMDAVNHFQNLRQVYDNSERLNHIFDVMGNIAPVAHIKDIIVRNDLVLHIDEVVPGEGLLDLGLVLGRFDALHPDGYGLIEHLPIDKIPLANSNVRGIATENGIDIH